MDRSLAKGIAIIVSLSFVLPVLLAIIWFLALRRRIRRERGQEVDADGIRVPIRMEDLLKHIQTMKFNRNGFADEFMCLIQKKHSPSDVGESNDNEKKNRSKDVITYDHSRVKLPILNEVSSSDYINASYINGYDKENAFIASQGPNKASLEDFWRMVWHKRCKTIVMLTTLTDQHTESCIKYWPEKGEVKQHSGIFIKTGEETVQQRTVTRHFKLQKGPRTLDVIQYQFLGWPDSGVPESADPLWEIIEAVENSEDVESPPIIVHCSAGCGQTGTFIALCILRRMMQLENKIDVFNVVNRMRGQRPKMVQVWEQYQFIFESLLIFFVAGYTSTTVANFNPEQWKDNDQKPMRKQLDLLTYLNPFTYTSEDLSGYKPKNRNKNRYPDLVPRNRFRPYLFTSVNDEETTNYINASFCPGTLETFIATQIPLHNTVVDFWRMVHDYDCSTIVTFQPTQNEDCGSYLPTDGSAQYGPFFLNVLDEAQDDDITETSLVIKNENMKHVNKLHCITHISVHQSAVLSCSSLLSVVDKLQQIQSQTKVTGIIVQSLDGVSECGIFIAVYNCCERIRNDGVVDLFTVVRGLRERRPEMVGTMTQYEFCLDVISEYLKRPAFDECATTNL